MGKPKITNIGRVLAERIAPFRIADSTDVRAVSNIIRKLSHYESHHGGDWGVALILNSSLGGTYLIMSKYEYEHRRPTTIEHPISFWPKSYFSDLKYKLEMAG